MSKIVAGFFYALLGVLSIGGWYENDRIYSTLNIDDRWVIQLTLTTSIVYIVCGVIFARALLKKPTAP